MSVLATQTTREVHLLLI